MLFARTHLAFAASVGVGQFAMTYRTPPSFPVLVTAFGGEVHGIDPASGRTLWSHQGKKRGDAHAARVVVLGGTVYAGPIDGELHLLEYTTGRLLRSTKIPHSTGGTVMTVDGQIYFAGNAMIDCFALDGELLWSARFDADNNARGVSLAVPGYSVQGDLRS